MPHFLHPASPRIVLIPARRRNRYSRRNHSVLCWLLQMPLRQRIPRPVPLWILRRRQHVHGRSSILNVRLTAARQHIVPIDRPVYNSAPCSWLHTA